MQGINGFKKCQSGKPVMFFLYEMVPGPEGNQVSVICWGGYGHAPSTPDVCMAQLISQHLEFVRVEVIVIPENVVMWWSACTLEKKDISRTFVRKGVMRSYQTNPITFCQSDPSQ